MATRNVRRPKKPATAKTVKTKTVEKEPESAASKTKKSGKRYTP
jgi:hypothetical protein